MSEDYESDIDEAKTMIKDAFNQTDHGKRTYYYKNAIDILDGYIRDNPETSQKILIESLKYTYTKELLEGLKTFNEHDINIDIIMNYLEIFGGRAKKEFQIICERFPHLEEEYYRWLNFFKDHIV